MELLLSFAGQNYFTLSITGFIVGGVPALLLYVLIRKMSKDKNISAMMSMFAVLAVLTVFSMITLNNPPFFILVWGWLFLILLFYKDRKKRTEAAH